MGHETEAEMLAPELSVVVQDEGKERVRVESHGGADGEADHARRPPQRSEGERQA